MNILFIADPVEQYIISKDTTHALMHECVLRGDNVFYAEKHQLSIDGPSLHVNATHLGVSKTEISRNGRKILTENEIDIVFIRTDPPFDSQYLNNTWMLSNFKSHFPILNSPDGIRTVNEKLWVSQFTTLTPKTVISANKTLLNDHISNLKKCIIKPMNGFGGQSIFIVNDNDPNKNVILETVSKGYTEEVILQEYLPDAQVGDKRVLLLNGNILGATLRVHSENDHRNNFFAGGKAEKATVTETEKKAIDHLRPYLQDLGLFFVGLDFIGERLIEVNVTSPTCLKEINELDKCSLETDIIEFAKTLV
jgi:glutathione synthase